MALTTAEQIEAEQRRIADRLAQAQHRIESAREQLAGQKVTLADRDRLVAVEVNPGGVLTDLRLSAATSSMDPDEVAARILATYRRACRAAAAHTYQVMDEFTGGDQQILAAIREASPSVDPGRPPEPDDEDDDWRRS